MICTCKSTRAYVCTKCKGYLDETKLEQENKGFREALMKINMGRHGELTTVQMALIAFGALNQSTTCQYCEPFKCAANGCECLCHESPIKATKEGGE